VQLNGANLSNCKIIELIEGVVMAVGIAASSGKKRRAGWKNERRAVMPPSAPSEVLSNCQKSENGVQHIAVDREWIRISRRIAGLETWVNVPTPSYRGVTLRSADKCGQYEIVLLHMDPSLELVLSREKDDSDIIALWRRFAATLDLPLLVEDSEGRLQTVSDGIAAGPFERRNGSALKGRRPRFLSRRRVGNMSHKLIHRGEYEMFACG
jgi:Family of unknown function (DUF6101)